LTASYALSLHDALPISRVDDENHVGQAAHAADAIEVAGELAALLLEAGDFLLRQRVVAAVGRHGFELTQPREAPLDGGEVGEESAEPALVHVEHAAACGLFGDSVLRLPLGADKQHGAPLGSDLCGELGSLAIELRGAPEIDDVDAVALAEDVGLHLRVPPFGLVAEVNAGLQQVLHGDRTQAE